MLDFDSAEGTPYTYCTTTASSRHRFASIFRCALAASLILAPGAFAAAQVTAVHGGRPDHIILNIPVAATVAAQCNFSLVPEASVDVGDILAGFARDIDFNTSCNTPFRVAVISQEGGLRAPPPAMAGFASLAPYDIRLTLRGDAGVASVSASCPAATLTLSGTPACIFRGPASETAGLRLSGRSSGLVNSTIRVSAPAYTAGTPLKAPATYSDTLTININPSP
jgi:hypothetical protein